MKTTLLAIDIGNTQINFGLFQGKRLVKDGSISSQASQNVKTVLAQIKRLSPKIKKVDQCVIASVVPTLTKVFQKAGIQLTGKLPLIVNAKHCNGLKIKVDNPKEVGGDRIVNSVAAYELFGAPAIVIDFGTAITFDLVSAKKEYLGGVIAPGMRLSSEALHYKTALLPQIKLGKPKRVRGTNTKTCIESGIFYSAVGLADTVITRLKKELRWRHPKIILTGGQATLISPHLSSPHVIEPKLTLKGLHLIFN